MKPLKNPILPVRVYVPWYGKQSWVYKYRISQPMEMGLRQRSCEFLVDTGGTHSEEARMQVMGGSDILFFHQINLDWILELCLAEPRPAIITSSDDHVEMIEPFNPGFHHTGTHNLTGKRLEPGDSVWWIPDGTHTPIWEDMKSYENDGKRYVFDIARNHAQLDMLKAIARESDGSVLSTEPLAAIYRGYGAKNVYVYPNSLDFTLYPQIDLQPHPQEVRILWTGGGSHYIDLYTIKDPLGRILKKYPQAKLIIFGQDFPILKKWFENANIEQIGWIDPDAYTYRLSTIGHDINLCALRPTPFAECKSAIKFYESAAICNPAATLGANFGPYQEIIDGETGFKYTSPEEFEWKLSELIENETLRKQLAVNAQEWVHNYRDVRFTTPPYIDWLRETSEKVHEYNRTIMPDAELGVGEPSPDLPPNEPIRKLVVASR